MVEFSVQYDDDDKKLVTEIAMEKLISCNDLVEAILLPLPLKPLLSFRLVSKQWNRLISSPRFRRSYTARASSSSISTTNRILLLSYDYSKYTENRMVLLLDHDRSVPETLSPFDISFSYTFKDYVERMKESCHFHIFHASNGLFLLSLVTDGDGLVVYSFVCNPLTKDYIELPPAPNSAINFVNLVKMKIVFNPLESLHYKVITVNRWSYPLASELGHEIQLYSSQGRTWEVNKFYKFSAEFDNIFNCVVLNDVLCWPPPVGRNYNTTFPGVELKGLCYTSLSFPEIRVRVMPLRWVYFGESRRHFYQVWSSDDKYFEIWEMENTQIQTWMFVKGFHQKNHVEVLHIESKDDEHCVQIFVLQGIYIYSMKLDTLHFGLVEYDTTKMLEYVGRPSDFQVTNLHQQWEAFSYSPTLFPLV